LLGRLLLVDFEVLEWPSIGSIIKYDLDGYLPIHLALTGGFPVPSTRCNVLMIECLIDNFQEVWKNRTYCGGVTFTLALENSNFCSNLNVTCMFQASCLPVLTAGRISQTPYQIYTESWSEAQ
jgi:hypothetical protein